MTTGTRAYLAAALAAFALLLAAYVVLTLADKDTAGVLTLGSPVLAGLLIAAKVGGDTAKQNETLAKIDKNTNGSLDGRIRQGVADVLTHAGVLPPVPVIPAQRDATDPDASKV